MSRKTTATRPAKGAASFSSRSGSAVESRNRLSVLAGRARVRPNRASSQPMLAFHLATQRFQAGETNLERRMCRHERREAVAPQRGDDEERRRRVGLAEIAVRNPADVLGNLDERRGE